MKMLEIGYSTKALWKLFRFLRFWCRERALESLSNVELLDTYLELLWGNAAQKAGKMSGDF